MRSRPRTVLLVVVVACVAVALVVGVRFSQTRSTGDAPVPTTPVSDSRSKTAGVVTLAVIGDSIAEGTGDSSGGWVQTVTRTACWSLTVSAQGGTGYTSAGAQASGYAPFVDRVSTVTSVSPDVVIVEGGGNDTEATTATITVAAKTTFARIRAALPSALVIAIGPPAAPGRPLAQLRRVSAAVRAAAASYQVLYIDPIRERWLSRKGSYSADGIHPDTAGHVEFANRVFQRLGSLGAKSSCR